jgi:hypothetical protein
LKGNLALSHSPFNHGQLEGINGCRVIESRIVRELCNLWKHAAYGLINSTARLKGNTMYILGIELSDSGALKVWSSDCLDKPKEIYPDLVAEPLCV